VRPHALRHQQPVLCLGAVEPQAVQVAEDLRSRAVLGCCGETQGAPVLLCSRATCCCASMVGPGPAACASSCTA
jgi:hypothetical protein